MGALLTRHVRDKASAHPTRYTTAHTDSTHSNCTMHAHRVVGGGWVGEPGGTETHIKSTTCLVALIGSVFGEIDVATSTACKGLADAGARFVDTSYKNSAMGEHSHGNGNGTAWYACVAQCSIMPWHGA